MRSCSTKAAHGYERDGWGGIEESRATRLEERVAVSLRCFRHKMKAFW
jgi:hypothetical protein